MISRETSIKNYKSSIKSRDLVSYHLDTVDERNNYLKMSRFTAGTLEMRSWNLGTKQLVAVYEQVCDPICGITQFNFFVVNGKSIEKQNIEDIIPGYATIYDDFVIKDNMTKELMEKFKRNEIIAYLLFRLPRTGNDITVLFGNEDTNETYTKFSKGNRMLLKWTNGTFVKDKIYWD